MKRRMFWAAAFVLAGAVTARGDDPKATTIEIHLDVRIADIRQALTDEQFRTFCEQHGKGLAEDKNWGVQVGLWRFTGPKAGTDPRTRLVIELSEDPFMGITFRAAVQGAGGAAGAERPLVFSDGFNNTLLSGGDYPGWKNSDLSASQRLEHLTKQLRKRLPPERLRHMLGQCGVPVSDGLHEPPSESVWVLPLLWTKELGEREIQFRLQYEKKTATGSEWVSVFARSVGEYKGSVRTLEKFAKLIPEQNQPATGKLPLRSVFFFKELTLPVGAETAP